MATRFDFLVIGTGIAGLFYALEVNRRLPEARIAVVTKKNESDTSTNRAQGGIAAVLSGTDSFSAHIEDTLATGCGLSKRDVVERVVESGPSVIQELIDYGVHFTKTEGELDLGREGGHSNNRVAHAADLTGQEIERALVAAVKQRRERITIFRNHIALDLVTNSTGGETSCIGVSLFSAKGQKVQCLYAPVVLLATGGLGQVYYHTTNPKIATGDGIAIAFRAGVSVANLEFVQFHPTTLYNPGRWPFLISEAVRGEGAVLKSVDGRRIMEGKHPLGDLAPRDIVARVIDKELKESGEEYVMLDISHREADFIKKRFPNIYRECLRRGFDITQRDIPVVPSAHYACGGILSTITGETELPGLYVAGEVAMTGMHGANRLASNSLLEAVVMAKLAAEKSCDYFRQVDQSVLQSLETEADVGSRDSHEGVLQTHWRRELQQVMSDFVGIVRTEERLQLAADQMRDIKQVVEMIFQSTLPHYDVIELRNMTTVAELMIQCAQQRRESRGLHYMEDYPESDKRFQHDTILTGNLRQRSRREVAP